MLTEHQMTKKLLKTIIKEKQQEIEYIIQNDPTINKLTKELNKLNDELIYYDEYSIDYDFKAFTYAVLLNRKKQELTYEIKYHPDINKLKNDIKALEITLETLAETKLKETLLLTPSSEVKKISLIDPRRKPHPLDRPSVDKKINFFHKQTKNFTIKKDYKNNQLSLWDKNNQLVNFSLFNNPNLNKNTTKNIDKWLDKTLRCSHYYNKLTKIFNKTNKEYYIVTTFDKQGDRIYIKYCHNSKTPNTTSVLHIKKKGKSYIETTKEIDCKKDYFEIPLKNNTTLEVSGLGHIGYDDYTLTAQLKHLEKQVKQNDLEKHFENIFNALNKQNHLG